MKLREAIWLCLDTETTGLDPATDRIVEIGAVMFQGGKPLWRAGTLIDPRRPIPGEATAVHGIRDEDVPKGFALDEARSIVSALARISDVVLAYNWPFDSGFFDAQLGDYWRSTIFGKPVIDPLVVVREVGRFWKGPGRHRLDAVAERLEIKREGDAHRAASDALLTCRVLWSLLEHLPEDADEAARWCASRRVEQDVAFAAWKARQSA